MIEITKIGETQPKLAIHKATASSVNSQYRKYGPIRHYNLDDQLFWKYCARDVVIFHVSTACPILQRELSNPLALVRI